MLETTSNTLALFERAAVEQADTVAIVFEDRELTYEQLDQLANRFALAYHDQGVSAGDRIGLSIDRCPEAIAAMLGAFKVGAAFVPLDPEYPADRIRFMIEDAGIGFVVTHCKATNPLAEDIDRETRVRWIDSAANWFLELSPTDAMAWRGQEIDQDSLAYIMYTSGSTGLPKGVQIEHGSLLTYCLADIEVYKLRRDDRTLQFSTLNFDIAIEEIFPPLLIGSCVVIRPRERSTQMNELSEIIERYQVTAVHIATAYWHEWVDLMVASESEVPASLRLAIATGEKVSTAHYQRWLKLCQHEVLWCNAYGPTEATVSATVYIPEEGFDDSDMPIGFPLPGYEAYILTEDYAPIDETGVTGELYLAGPALSRGYLNRGDLTSKAFLNVCVGGAEKRLYRTGDLARWMEDGAIEFAGRIDHQIKLGSYRIEPGEIEASLNKHSHVLESLITYEQIEAQKFLLAYVAVGNHDVSVEQLAEHLRDEVPAYMVPARYILLSHFPKTINGKIDRQNLPPVEEAKTAEDGTFATARCEVETHLCDLWARVLNLPRVGIYDDFFALGGSSLLVTRIVSELKQQWDIELPVRDFFANPTVAMAARHLRRLLNLEELDYESEDQERLKDQKPQVEPAFIGCCGRELFTVLYRPAPSCKVDRQHAVLICHPLGHEYTRSYRNLQQLALMLAGQGFEVLRFDYFGTGNSNGECGDFRSESLQSDTRRAANYLMETTAAKQLSLIGLRMGATLASMLSSGNELDHEIANIVALDPVSEGTVYLETLARLNETNLHSQTRFIERVEVRPDQAYGHTWGAEKSASLSKLRLAEASALSAQSNLMLLSNGYLDNHALLEPYAKQWNCIPVQDEIWWWSPEFTESAFASPESNQKILEFLLETPEHG